MDFIFSEGMGGNMSSGDLPHAENECGKVRLHPEHERAKHHRGTQVKINHRRESAFLHGKCDYF